MCICMCVLRGGGNGANKDMTCTFAKDSLVPRPKPQGKESGNETLLKKWEGT